jgi:site-specific DNA-cytosine methylase
MKGADGDKIVDISDSQRYKQCGNAVSVPVVQAVGLKIKELINES